MDAELKRLCAERDRAWERLGRVRPALAAQVLPRLRSQTVEWLESMQKAVSTPELVRAFQTQLGLRRYLDGQVHTERLDVVDVGDRFPDLLCILTPDPYTLRALRIAEQCVRIVASLRAQSITDPVIAPDTAVTFLEAERSAWAELERLERGAGL